MDLLGPGAVLAGYRVEEMIGSGGMSVVYRARQLALDRPVALKVIADCLAADPVYVERFRREALAAASLEHPHVVPVYDSGEAGGRLFIVMRLVAGHDLCRLLEREGPLAPEVAVGVIAQVADALDAAHRAGIVHRDVKPANVLLSGGSGAPHAYLSDFGIVRWSRAPSELTNTGVVLGTPGYMAPEVMRGGDCGPAADVYALGCVLFEALTGSPPFAGADPSAVMAAHLMDPPPEIAAYGVELPPGLEIAVRRALSKQPGERFSSAGAFAKAARGALLSVHPAGGLISPATAGPDRGQPGSDVEVYSTSLVGREREIADVCELLAQKDSRVVTLTGPGGMGKTRLALAVAERIGGAFADGVAVVPLASVRSAGLVLPTIAQRLAIPERPEEQLGTTVANALADRELLLVLDNFEQLMSAASVLAELIAGTAGLKLLITSRAPLRIAPERTYAVPPLSLPDGEVERGTGALVAGSEAARLFIARAREARPELAFSTDSYQAVADICRRLEGMPLALELAAARASHLSIGELAERLDRRLGLLTRGRADMPPRHQSVRAAIDTSYELLEPAQREMFARLGVFVGGFTLDAGEAICGPDVDFLDGLWALIDNSLVRYDDAGGRGRYAMLEVIREYALERLEASTEAAIVQERHTDYYLALADRLAPALRPGVVDPAAIAMVSAEHGNIRAALRRLDTLGDGVRLLRLAVAVGPYWVRQFLRDEAVYWVDRGLTLEPDPEPLVHAGALCWRGWARIGTNDNASARADIEEALALCEPYDAPRLKLDVLYSLGFLENLDGRTYTCEQYTLKALAVARRLGDRATIGAVMANLADVTMQRGDWEAARRYAIEGVAMQEESVDRGELATARHNLGLALLHLDEIPQAGAQAASALALSVEADHIEAAWMVLLLISAVACASGFDEPAARLLGGVDALRRHLGFQTYPTVERRVFERTRSDLQRDLGDELFQRAWDHGAALSVESLIELGTELADACAAPVARSRSPDRHLIDQSL